MFGHLYIYGVCNIYIEREEKSSETKTWCLAPNATMFIQSNVYTCDRYIQCDVWLDSEKKLRQTGYISASGGGAFREASSPAGGWCPSGHFACTNGVLAHRLASLTSTNKKAIYSLRKPHTDQEHFQLLFFGGGLFSLA